MLPSHQLELAILRYVRVGGSDGWRPTSLPDLANVVKCQEWSAILDALKRLHHQNSIQIRKWTEPEGFSLYESESDGTEFFHQGSFQIEITFHGRTYMEALEAKEKLEQPLIRDLALTLERTQKGLRGGLVPSLEAIHQVMSGPSPLHSQLIDALEGVAQTRIRLEEAFLSHPILEATHNFNQLQKSLAAAIQPVMSDYGRLGELLAADMERSNKLVFDAFAKSPIQESLRLLVDQAKAIGDIYLALPKAVSVTWPAEILAPRLILVEDTLKNVNVWETLRTETMHAMKAAALPPIPPIALEVAGQFVFGHGTLVRRLPPAIPSDADIQGTEEEFRHRDEEVGAKLETELAQIDAKLLDLRRSSWRNLAKRDAGSVRLAMAGIRELYSEVLHLLAPDDEVKKTDAWRSRRDNSLRQPTRRMRIEFIVGATMNELDALLQFDESIEHAHKFTHSFADDPELVRLALSALENCAYLLIISSKPKKSQN